MKIESIHIEDVADAWRILGGLGLVDTIFNHISSLASDICGGFHLIMNPNGFLASEVTQSNLCVFPLLKYVPSDAFKLRVNPDGLHLHSAIHLERMREGVIIHTHSENSIAVSCYKEGLLPLSQIAIEFVGDIEYVEYNGVFRSNTLSPQLINFAKKGGIALLRHHGSLVIADTVEEALYLAYFIEVACKIQVLSLSQGVTLCTPEKSAIEGAQQVLRKDRITVAKEFFEAFRRQIK